MQTIDKYNKKYSLCRSEIVRTHFLKVIQPQDRRYKNRLFIYNISKW